VAELDEVRADRDREGSGEGDTSKDEDDTSKKEGRGRRRSSRSNGKPSGRQLVDGARDQLVEITGRPAYGVSALTRTEDGWIARVDLMELERIPPSTSVLGSYEVELDEDGNLVGYERVRRFHLAQVDDE